MQAEKLSLKTRFSLLCLVFVLTGAAQEENPPPSTLKQMTLEELSQIQVTTLTKEPARAFQTPAAIYVITGDQIRRSGATSIPEALRLAPGVEVARVDANKWAIGIRGFGTRLSRAVLVLIDGRTVYTPLFAGTYWEVQDTFMDDIDRIEVIRGPGGTIWGPNAVDGVINIITKSSAETQGVLGNAGGGNEEQGFVNSRYGGSNGKNLTWRVYGKTFTRGPEYHPDGLSFDDWRASQGGFRIDWKRDATDVVTLQGDLYSEEAGEANNPVTYTAPYSRIVYANADLSGGNVLARWDHRLKAGGDLQLQVYYDRTNRYEPNLAERRNTFDIDFIHSLPLSERNRLTWGLGSRFSPTHDIEVVSGLTFQPDRRTDSLYSAFLQDEVGLIPGRLSLTAGSKILRTNFTDFEFEPSLRLAWTPSNRQTVWAAFTHAVRTPSDAEENFYLSGYTGSMVNGLPLMARFNANSNFAPEQMNGYELGTRRLLGRSFAAGVASFYNHYHDLFDEEFAGSIFLEDNPAPPHYLLPAQFGNGLLGNTKGIEVSATWEPAASWQIRGNYSYLDMSIWRSPHSGDIGTAPGIVGSSPQHEANVQSSFQISKNLQLDLIYRYSSALPGQLVPAYSTGDANFTWRFSRIFEVSVAGRNLLQPHHPEFGGDPGPLVGIRRSAYLKLTWRR